MKFNKHPEIEGRHADFSPSSPAWMRYNDEKLVSVFLNKKAMKIRYTFLQ